MEEEYLEEDIQSETEIEGQSEYIVIEEDIGETEYLEEDEAEAEEEELEKAEGVEVEGDLEELLKAEGDETTFVNPQDVEFIYAEGVGENNEIIIGEVPRFSCKHCGAACTRGRPLATFAIRFSAGLLTERGT